jgi:hypothetical protein
MEYIVSVFVIFSQSNATTGEGLEEGLTWLMKQLVN